MKNGSRLFDEKVKVVKPSVTTDSSSHLTLHLQKLHMQAKMMLEVNKIYTRKREAAVNRNYEVPLKGLYEPVDPSALPLLVLIYGPQLRYVTLRYATLRGYVIML